MSSQFCTCSPVVICCSTSSPTTLQPSMFTVAFHGYLGATLSVIHQFAGGPSQGISSGTLSVGTIACTAGSGNNPDVTVSGNSFSPAVVYTPGPGFATNGDAFLWGATDSAGKNPGGGGLSAVNLIPANFSYAIPPANQVLTGNTYAATLSGTYTAVTPTYPPTTVVLSGNNYGDSGATHAGTLVTTYPPTTTVVLGNNYGDTTQGTHAGTYVTTAPTNVATGVSFGPTNNLVGSAEVGKQSIEIFPFGSFNAGDNIFPYEAQWS